MFSYTVDVPTNYGVVEIKSFCFLKHTPHIVYITYIPAFQELVKA